jgi:hypothetical protein
MPFLGRDAGVGGEGLLRPVGHGVLALRGDEDFHDVLSMLNDCRVSKGVGYYPHSTRELSSKSKAGFVPSQVFRA